MLKEYNLFDNCLKIEDLKTRIKNCRELITFEETDQSKRIVTKSGHEETIKTLNILIKELKSLEI